MSAQKFDYLLTFDVDGGWTQQSGRCTAKQYKAKLENAPIGTVGNLRITSGSYQSVIAHRVTAMGVIHFATWAN